MALPKKKPPTEWKNFFFQILCEEIQFTNTLQFAYIKRKKRKKHS